MISLSQAAVTKTRLILNKTGLRDQNKVFAIGFNKTGTTSIHTLFRKLGLPSYHGEKWRSCDDKTLFNSYDCFSDGIPSDLQKLDNMYPRSKYILQVRDLDEWIYSRLAHIKRNKRNNRYRKGERDWNNTNFAVKSWIRQRNAYHLKVLSYFSGRRSDILIVNFIRDDKAVSKICNFLGYEAIYEKPKKNVRPDKQRPEKHIRMLKECANKLGIQEEELKYDIYCPSLVDDPSCDRYPPDSSMLQYT